MGLTRKTAFPGCSASSHPLPAWNYSRKQELVHRALAEQRDGDVAEHRRAAARQQDADVLRAARAGLDGAGDDERADEGAAPGELDAARGYAESCENAFEKALAAEKASVILQELRKGIDSLEEITDNDLWPLPKYRELLFIS